jgi:hypothetical protein
MEAKWPFMLITLGLLIALGFTIANLERSTVMNDWENRRCDLPIMTASFFFKPDTDTRTKSAFASDNFNFCMKTFVDRFINLFSAPIATLLGKQVDASMSAANAVNMVRNIAHNMHEAFTKYISSYFKKFTASVFEMNRMLQYFKMAIDRINGIVTSMIFSGLSIFRGIINFILYVIRVVMVICGIMLIIIIILFFVLFPVMPIILATLTTIITGVLIFSGVISGTIASEAEGQRKGFCFSEDTEIPVKVDGKEKRVRVQDIKVGDKLGEYGNVTAIIQMDGTHVELYNLDGVYVSESHLVQGTDKVWKAVSSDERAVPSDKKSAIVYCFNTTSNIIPVCGITATTLYRDWEEISNEDKKGQYIWNYMVLCMLNKYEHYDQWKKDVKQECDVAVMGKDMKVKTAKGWVRLSEISFPGGTVLDRNGKEQGVRGIIHAEVENVQYGDKYSGINTWHTELYEERDGVWMKGDSISYGEDTIQGMTLITDNGEFIIWDEVLQKEVIVRDFTEVGYQSIHETYSFVAARLSGS